MDRRKAIVANVNSG